MPRHRRDRAPALGGAPEPGRTAPGARSPYGDRDRGAPSTRRQPPGGPGVPPAKPRRRGRTDGSWIQQPLTVGELQRYADPDLDPAGAARRLPPRGRDVRVADQPQFGTLDREAGGRVRCADVLVHGVARAAVPALHLAAACRGLARAHPLHVGAAQPFAGELDRAHRGRARLAEPGGLGRSGRAVVVVAHQRHGAALARARHHMLGVRPPADHVPQRPQLLRTTRLGRADHRVQRFRMRVRVAEHRYDHGLTLERHVAAPAGSSSVRRASPNGLPSESLQIAHASPGCTTLPPSASTRSSASATSGTAK